MKNLQFLLLLFSIQFVAAQEMLLQKGVVIDTLSVNDSIAETYSLYLPQDFTTERTWPVIFVFDTDGRGRRAIQLFRQAAEDQGYIVAASNNIEEDNSLLDNIRVGTRMMNRVYNVFPVDKNLMYTAGFAEGARVATALKAVYADLKGVVAVGDTWINADFLKKTTDFAFIGLAGTRNYRIHVLGETVDLMNKAGINADLLTYEGGLEWPETHYISNAIGKLTLKAMDKGLRQKDPALAEKIYQQELETAERLRGKMELYKAYEWLEQMKGTYALYNKKSDIRQRQKEISGEKLFRRQRRSYNRAELREAEKREEFIYFLNEDVYTSNFENLGWWSQQVKELEEMQKGEVPAEREMAFRLQGLLQSYATNTYEELENRNAGIDPLIFTAILQTIFEPLDPEGYKKIISLSAQDGDYYTALLYLEDLLKTGYSNLKELYNIPGTLDLKLSPEFNELVKKYLGESRFYDN